MKIYAVEYRLSDGARKERTALYAYSEAEAVRRVTQALKSQYGRTPYKVWSTMSVSKTHDMSWNRR